MNDSPSYAPMPSSFHPPSTCSLLALRLRLDTEDVAAGFDVERHGDEEAIAIRVAVEKRGEASSRIRMAVIPAFKQTTMLAVVQRHVAPGSTVCTDGRRSYGAFAGGGRGAYRPHATDEDRRCAVTPSVVPLADRALGHLQQWLTATYHGVSKGQLQVYLDEFVFRHTRRRQPMAAFQTLLGLGSGRARAPHRLIRGAKDVAATD